MTTTNCNSIKGAPIDAVGAAKLPFAFASVIEPNQDVAAMLQIQQTMSLYAVLVDGKQFDKLDLVFHNDVWANYSALLGVLHPLSALKTGLQRSVSAVMTQHALTTQLVDVAKNGTSARSATYFTASHFGTEDFYGQTLWGWGTYEDYWIKESTTGRWKIIQRTMTYPGPLIGNISIFEDVFGDKSSTQKPAQSKRDLPLFWSSLPKSAILTRWLAGSS
ncbi:hypothetical protein AJ79_03602 [Helicocarpus griseus UAMH5409]|uniref:SnoaL-like domain-containing protein n=1 Tax=Helicocarpus griseus UAMH5409 TaxID=1447875 RepID=A0A2B7XXX5_9EURO|nr:hypothetical protein AJ79_03602 [Helicocarpus griseus UAMH5409]